MRCATHGLAAGPDGLCVLCRGRRHRGDKGSNGPLVALVATVLLVGGTALAFRLLGGREHVPSQNERTLPVVKEAPIAAAPAVEQPGGRDVPATNALAEPPFPVAAAPPAVVAAEAPLASASAAPSALASSSAAPAAPSDAAVTAALRATPIVMFTTSWCGVCRQARAFFDANGLRPTERDIERDPAARAEIQRLTGKTSVPVFLVDGGLVTGFSEGSMKQTLVASVERRLGVKASARDRAR